jgi:signal peptidase II
VAQLSRRVPTWPLFVALFVVLADEISQYLVIRYLQPLGPTGVPIIGSFLRLVYLENTGVSFGQLQQFSSWITIFTALVVVGLCVGYRYLVFPSPWANLALGLILGGALGNLIDRILTGVRLGLANAYVVDFVDVRYFAVFNVADSAITIGGILYGVYLVFFHKEGDKPKEKDPCPPPETLPPAA